MSNEITIEQNIDNIQTKLNNLSTDTGSSNALEGSLTTQVDAAKSEKKSLMSSVLSFPNIICLLLPVLLIIILIVIKPGFVMNVPDKNNPDNKHLSIQKCVMYGGVTGVALGGALFFYLNSMKNKGGAAKIA